MNAYVEIWLICNFYPSRARNATSIILKLNNFAEVLAVRVHVDVYKATAALRSLTLKTLCDTGQRTPWNLPTTTYPSPNPSTLNHLYLLFLWLRHKKTYLTRDYYDGFINDRVKYGSGKIWRNRSKPTTFSRSLFYRCPTFQLQNSKILFQM